MIHRLVQCMASDRELSLEIGPGDIAEVRVVTRGGSPAEEAVFGRREGDRRRPLLWQSLTELHGGQAALWETKRCTVPVAAIVTRGSPRAAIARWLPGEPGIVHLAGLHSISDVGGRLRSSFSLLVEVPAGGAEVRPLYLHGVEPGAWLRFSGNEAVRHLAARWVGCPGRAGRDRRRHGRAGPASCSSSAINWAIR